MVLTILETLKCIRIATEFLIEVEFRAGFKFCTQTLESLTIAIKFHVIF